MCPSLKSPCNEGWLIFSNGIPAPKSAVVRSLLIKSSVFIFNGCSSMVACSAMVGSCTCGPGGGGLGMQNRALVIVTLEMIGCKFFVFVLHHNFVGGTPQFTALHRECYMPVGTFAALHSGIIAPQ